MWTRLLRLPLIEDALTGPSFIWSVQRFLRRPISPEEARRILSTRLLSREADFLAVARRSIYANRGSPYRELLRLAGCEYGDLERLVCQQGLEGTLRVLFQQGVYLAVDEFKGRRPAVRGSATITVAPERLLNPDSAYHILMQSSGSRGSRVRAPCDLAFLRDVGVYKLLGQAAQGGIDWVRAIWRAPGGTALYSILVYGSYGASLAHWFSQLDPGDPGLDWRYRWSIYAMRLSGFLAGIRMPLPEHVPVDAPLPIARWMANVIAAGRTPHLETFASSATRLCVAAAEAGIELAGARFDLTGEPLTDAVLRTVRSTGAEASGVYGSMEAGPLGRGCVRPEVSDDLHAVTDFHGFVQPGPHGRERHLPANALLITCLRPTAPFILLNTSLGDAAEVVQRSCGCPLDELGWSTHLHSIRSFEKLTAGGVTFLDTDVVRVLEEVLPARFGGGPTDYQFVEHEDPDGAARLSLVVHPSLGALDPQEVAEAFLTSVGLGPGPNRVMELQWRQAGLLQVERRPPLAGESGKILHLHKARRNVGRMGERPSSS